MACETWTTYGYGINSTEIEESAELTVEKLEKLISLSKEVSERYETFKKDYNNFSNTVGGETLDINVSMILNEFVDNYYIGYGGLATILRAIILDNDGIDMCVCDNLDNITYLLFPPIYPWEMKDKERNLTTENLDKIFDKYLSVLTDKKYIIDFYSVTNCG